MSVAPEDIAVCKCYRTPNDQVRHVMSISGDEVTFETRGKKHKPFPWDRQPVQNRDRFAGEVVEEVRCDWDPDFAPLEGPTA